MAPGAVENEVKNDNEEVKNKSKETSKANGNNKDNDENPANGTDNDTDKLTKDVEYKENCLNLSILQMFIMELSVTLFFEYCDPRRYFR